MPKYVRDLIFPAQDLGGSKTQIIDIRTKNIISRLEFTYKTTFGSSAQTNPAPACVTKIELVDGSKVLHSTVGYTNQALAYYNRPGVAMEHGQHIPSNSQLDIYALDFGRWLWDRELAFDPKRFANPQLKITTVETGSESSADAGTLEVIAEEFKDSPPSPSGFLRAVETWSGSFLADNSVNEVLLPADEVIRQILVRAHQDGYEPWYQVDIAKLDQQGDGEVIFDEEDLEQYYRRMKSRWPMLHVPFIAGITTTARVFYIAPSDYWASISGLAIVSDSGVYTSGASIKGGKASLVSSADRQQVGVARGYLPWSTFQFPMGTPNDIDSWYDPTGKAPRLRLTSNSGGTSGDGNVLLETVMKY